MCKHSNLKESQSYGLCQLHTNPFCSFSTQTKLAQKAEYNSTAQQRLYPSIPSPPRPLSLPLAEYSGTYTHPAYPDFIISVTTQDEPQLRVVVTGAFPFRLHLKHVSGDFFLAEVFLFRLTRDPDVIVRAEFQIDAQGKVARFGAAVEFSSMPDKLIWFERSA